MIENDDARETPAGEPRWQPVAAIDRRVLGVLVEKAKTTPSAYPLSVNAVVAGSNQKSNRHPVMELQMEDVEASLERLRGLGAVGMIQGYGRVVKYRHYLYEWLGVDKLEIAVMAELLLRGAQTEGELRIRASRMEPIPDLTVLRNLLAALASRGLVLSLSPEGRGHVVSHALYLPAELEKIKAQYAAVRPMGAEDFGAPAVEPPVAGATTVGQPPLAGQAGAAPRFDPALADSLRDEVEELRTETAQLRNDLEALAATLRQVQDELQRLRQERQA
jgi:hypothetical protein